MEAGGHRVQLAGCALAEVPPHDDWLTAAECAVQQGLRLEKRRREWRAGRWCAKLAVGALTQDPPARLEIVAAPDGAPEVRGTRTPTSLSITHRAERALAAATLATLRLGCDLEYIEPRSERFIRDYLTAAEAERVLAAAGRQRDLLANLCWSGKECVVKALRTGLRADTRSVEVTLPATVVVEENSWQPLRARTATGERFEGWWRAEGDWLVAVVADRPFTLRG